MELCGVSKSNSSVDYAMLEYCIREDLKMSEPRMMAVLDPLKLVIDNYPEGLNIWMCQTIRKIRNWEREKFRLPENFILREAIL